MIRATTFRDKRVAVFGLGGSGLASARSLVEGGADVVCWDDGDAGRVAAAKQGFTVADLAGEDWSRIDALLLAPGVALTHPEPHWSVKLARAAGVEIIGDIEVFFRERAAHCPDAPVVCITGTNGKSTTTALIAHMLREIGRDVQMGGNIGKAILTLEPASAGRIHVIEMSSFQIDLTPSLKPTVGVLLNITPDHLDRHGPADDLDAAMANYAAIKERLVAASGVAVVGIDDDHGMAILKRRVASGPVAPVSAKRAIAPGYCEHDRWLICSDATALAQKLATTYGISTLRGRHNTQNALAAVAAVRELFNATGDRTACDWQAVLYTYPGLPHRMEEAGRVGRVVFINDSKATNADSTDKALAAFPSDIFWILGGKPKEGGIASLEPLFGRVAKAYLIGYAADQFAATLDGKVAYEHCGTLDVAVAAAARDAAASSAKEPVVLLSPACASYDQFKSFEHRGDEFLRLVSGLPDATMKGRTP
ncbi:MAG: UDP-N-acetylmuramoyl-L-alanine--D-glutamate ligase [Hyphomicrobiaceae bacterium]